MGSAQASRVSWWRRNGEKRVGLPRTGHIRRAVDNLRKRRDF